MMSSCTSATGSPWSTRTGRAWTRGNDFRRVNLGGAELVVAAHVVDDDDVRVVQLCWLDSLLAMVRVCDPAIERAWEQVMGIGIAYLCSRYNE